MINVSSAFREALANDNRTYIERAVITLEDGTVLNLGNAQLWNGGYEIDDAVSSENSFSAIGSAIVNSAKLVINNIYDDYSDYVFDNAKAVLYIGLELENGGQTIVESIKKGTYIVDEAQYNGSIITLSLLDNMYFFDRPYSESVLVYPASCDTIIRNACTICGINLASTTFPNRDTVIAERPTDEAITFREIIAYVSQICGCYARCNTDGDLELKWFDTEALEDPTSSIYHIDSIYKSDISMDDVVITGVRATYNVTIDEKEETLTYLSGAEGYVIEISKNPMITGLTVKDIVDRLGTQLIGLRFRKANASHSSDPTLEAGDVAILDDRKGNSYPILITRTKFKVGAAQTTICGAETPTRKSAARYSEETKNYVEIRKKINNQKDAFDRALEELSERIDEAEGMFTTQVQTQSGGIITYLHNKPILAESDIQIMISNVGVTVTSNGTDVDPTWYGLTVDGNLISNILNTVGINASWINTGQIVITKDGTEVFFADVDTGTVRISGNSISITSGDAIDTAIASRASTTTRQIMDNAGAYGLGWRVNASTFKNTNNGECYFYGYDAQGVAADINGWVQWKGDKVLIPKGCHINPNNTMPYDTDLYTVYRTSNSSWHDVCWDKTNKQWVANTYTGSTPSARVTWVWDDDTDIVIASYRIPIAEGAIYSAQLYTPPKKHTELAEAAYEYAEDGLASLESQVDAAIQDIQDQLDGVVEQFFYDYDPRPNVDYPSSQNYPVSSWQASEYADHEGDMFLDTSTGVSYRWINENNTWYWKEIPDTAAAQALQLAHQAKDTADGKRRVFINTPTPPYDVGDIWMGGANGDILTCTTAKTSGESFATTDFEKLNKYGEGDALYLETPFEWSQDGKTANFTAIIYQDDVDITVDYPNSWFEWYLRTENGEERIAIGKTCSVSKSALGYGGTVTCVFTTYEEAALTTRSNAALQTNSGLTLTTYVAAEGTQPVTELPIKTASQVSLDDYIMGIDAADGYQVSVRNFATRIATGVLDTRYVNTSGDTISGSLNLKLSGFDVSLADNGVSSVQYPTTFNVLDENSKIATRLEGIIKPSGEVGSYWYVRNYNSSGTLVAQKGIQMLMDKSGNLTYVVGDADKFRSAIGAVNKTGDTMTGALNFANNTYNNFGDDVAIGDINVNGKLGIKGLNGATGIRFVPYSGSTVQDITINGSGTMTISGSVNISGNTISNGNIYRKVSTATRGTNPTSNVYSALEWQDSASKRLTMVEHVLTTNGRSQLNLYVLGNYTSADAYGGIAIFKDVNNTGNYTATFNANTGIFTATGFSGSGASLTSLNADNISSGTLPVARGGTGKTYGYTWQQLGYATGTTRITFNLANYSEVMVVCRVGTSYLASSILPKVHLSTTEREFYLGGAAARRAGCRITSTYMYAVIVQVDSTYYTSSAEWWVFAR